MSYEGKTQITLMCTVTPDQVADGDRIFASHAEWMKRTHYRDGDLALLRYNIVKAPELSNPLDPSSEPTGDTTFVLTEIYESPAGVADHWKQGQESWEDFGAFVEWLQNGRLTMCHGSPIIHSLW